MLQLHTGFKGSWLCMNVLKIGAEITGYSFNLKLKENLYDRANIRSILKKSINWTNPIIRNFIIQLKNPEQI